MLQGRSAPGPVGAVYKHVCSLGWSWPLFDSFQRTGRCPLPLLSGPDTWWKHELRDGLRLAAWASAAARRDDMKGIEACQGVDRRATMALLGTKLSHVEVGLLRRVMSGSIRLQKRLHVAGLAACSLCPFCGLCDESVRHCVWECPRWSDVREKFVPNLHHMYHMLPACSLDCGIFVEDARVLDLAFQLHHEEQLAHDVSAFYNCRECRSAISASRDVQESQTLWTDASNNQDDRFRRAGSGIFYGDGHDLNLSMLVLGFAQTNQRAELLAVVVACLRDPRPLDIRTDSEYVCKGVACWKSWAGEGWNGDHADLWNLLAVELCARQSVVLVSWVKGHAKQVDVDRGRTTEEDRTGNDGADALAVAGAGLHQVPAEVVADARERKEMAVNVQRMMVSVLQARFEAESHDPNDARHADRGSDCDCMEFECMEFLEDEVAAHNGEGILNGAS